MNKYIKLILLITILIFLIIPMHCVESIIIKGLVNGAGQAISDNENHGTFVRTFDSNSYSFAATIINWLWAISIIVAIIILIILGIKYITGGIQEKADYKKSLIPFFIGVLLVVFATTIVKVLFTINI